MQTLPGDDALPVGEWPIEIDEPVELFVVHPHIKYAPAAERGDWAGWFLGYWTDFNGGGWVWEGMCGTVTHVRPVID